MKSEFNEIRFFVYIFIVALAILIIFYGCSSWNPEDDCQDVCLAHNQEFKSYSREGFVVQCYCGLPKRHKVWLIRP